MYFRVLTGRRKGIRHVGFSEMFPQTKLLQVAALLSLVISPFIKSIGFSFYFLVDVFCYHLVSKYHCLIHDLLLIISLNTFVI